jgi:hypothetical protein
VGSRRVVKSVDLAAEEGKDHYYPDGDLWTRYADEHRLADVIPKNHIIYGELIGFSGPDSPIQKGYTYQLPDGQARLYVYRVAMITDDGLTIDYSPEQMVTFCRDHDLDVVPTLWSGPHEDFVAEAWLERRFYDEWSKQVAVFNNAPVALSDKKLVDEGVCVRYDGPFGTYIVKAKSPSFLAYETKLLDAGVEDLESDEADADAPEEVAAA